MKVEDVRAARGNSPALTWVLLLLPLVLLGLILAYIVATGAGLGELKGPPVEQLAVERITLPRPGMIEAVVVNDGPQETTVAQVAVDDAFWSFTASPSPTIPRLGQATFQIPYPWVREELHAVKFITSIGMTFEGQIPAAVQSPQPSSTLFMRFGLLGLYVGIVPILLGMLWYPLLRRSGRTVMNFVLCLTVGLLLYLAVSTRKLPLGVSTDVLVGLKPALGQLLEIAHDAVFNIFIILLLVPVAKAVVRKLVPASLVVFAVLALFLTFLLASLLGETPPGSGVAVIGVTGVLLAAAATYVLSRFGGLMLMAAFFSAGILLQYPLTLDAAQWYFAPSMAGALAIGALAVFGFRQTVAKRAVPTGWN